MPKVTKERKPHMPSPYDGMTETELRGVVISKLIDAVRPLRGKFSVGWKYEDGKFCVEVREK